MSTLSCLFTLSLILTISHSQVAEPYTTYGAIPNNFNVPNNFQNAYSSQAVMPGSFGNAIPTLSNVAPVPGNLIPLDGSPIIQQTPFVPTTAFVPQNQIQIQPIQTIQPIQISTPYVQQPQQTTQIPISYNSSIPLPTPISNNQPAYGQITINQGMPQTQMYAPNCAEYVNGSCTRCSFRFAQGVDGVCEPVNPLCATWDSNGACLTCYVGYEICESGCIMSQSCAPEGTYDPNCRNTTNGVCQQCSQGYYFNQNGICTQSNPFCRTSDNQGNCLTCYAGYGLNAGNCTVQSDPANNNPYCSRFVNGVCQQCSNYSWFNGNTCVPFDPMCSRTDTTNGNCLSCYSGYLLQGGRCILNNNTQPTDLLCRRWNSNGVCVECSNNAYFRQNMCVAADPLCRTSNNQNGGCLTCYAGYNLQNGRCVVTPPDAGYQNSNQYCAIWEGTNCRQCARNAYFNANRICVPNNPLCATSGINGQCLSCYNGYILQNNNCIVNNVTVNVGNALCARWDGSNCVQCATRSFNFNGICTAVNTLCNTYDNFNGFCSSCYNGYIMSGNTCTINNQNVVTNPLCKTWNGPNCVECATRSYFVGTICSPVNASCATWNSQNGQCTSCYSGFYLQGSTCLQQTAPSGPSQSTDIYCARTDSRGLCIRCFYGFTLQNGTCVADFKNTPCGRNPAFCRN